MVLDYSCGKALDDNGVGSSGLRAFLLLVIFWLVSVVLQRTMAAGRATSPRLRRHKTDRYLPVAKGQSPFADQLFSIAGMGFMAEATGPPLANVGDMDEMEVPVTVAEFCIEGGLFEPQQLLVMALQA